ncbi:hypothetical protein ACJX0J_039387 [Zea mays]
MDKVSLSIRNKKNTGSLYNSQITGEREFLVGVSLLPYIVDWRVIPFLQRTNAKDLQDGIEKEPLSSLERWQTKLRAVGGYKAGTLTLYQLTLIMHNNLYSVQKRLSQSINKKMIFAVNIICV